MGCERLHPYTPISLDGKGARGEGQAGDQEGCWGQGYGQHGCCLRLQRPPESSRSSWSLTHRVVSFPPSDTRVTCYKDQGISYRGTWSTVESGAECVNWNSSVLVLKPYSARRPGAIRLGLGNHNYCR